jgi:MFS family permease
MTVSSAIAMLALGLSESVFFAVLDGLDKPVGFLGVISTFQGIGAMAAGVAVTSLLRRCGEVRLLLIALGTATVAALAVDSTAVVVVLIGAAMFGAALPGLIVASTTMLQQRTPNPVMGRTAAAFDLATGLPYALSIGLGAVLLAFVSYRAIILGMAAGLALATFLAAQWLPPAAEPATPPPIATLGRRPCPAGVAPSAP